MAVNRELRDKLNGMDVRGLEDNLDKVFNAYIMKRDKYSCVITGGQRNTNVSHLFGKAMYPNVRWNEYNACCMVKSVHRNYHEADPFIYIDWFIKQYGEEKLQELKSEAYARKHIYSVSELIELTNQYVQKTKALPKCRTSNGRYV